MDNILARKEATSAGADEALLLNEAGLVCCAAASNIFIFKNNQEWFDFLNFMNCYSKETGLFFTESQSNI